MLLLSWTCTDESPTSGLTMLVVDIPSGYIMLQVNYDDNDVHCMMMMMRYYETVNEFSEGFSLNLGF